MFELFKSPIFPNNESTRKARIFFLLILSATSIISFYSITLCFVLPNNILRWLFLFIVFNSVSLILLALNRKGYFNISGILFIILFYVILFGFAWTAGGIKAPAVKFFPIIIMFAGLIRGWRYGILTGLIVALGGLGLVVAEYQNFLSENVVVPSSISLFVGSLLVISLTVILQYLSVASLDKALQESQKELSLRKKAEHLSEISEKRYRSIFENANDAIFIMKDDKIIECNPRTLETFGCTKEQILNQTPYYFSPEVQPDGINSKEKTFQLVSLVLKGTPKQFEWQHCRLDKSIFEAEVSLNRLEINNELFLLAIIRDITQRKKVERENLMLTQAVRSISECVSITSTEDRILFVNKSFLNTYQYEEQELIDKSISIVQSQNNSPQIIKDILPSTLIGGWQGELINRRKDGSEFPVFLSTSVIRDEGGTPLALIGVSIDITERLKAENALRESEALMAGLLNGITQPTFMIDAIGTLLYLNEAFGKLLNKPINELLGKNTFELLPSNLAEERRKIIEKVFNDSTPHNFDDSRGNKHFTNYIYPILNNEGKTVSVVVFALDITERKLAEKSLRESQQRFRLILENMPILLNAFDEKGNIIVWNKACEKASGYLASEIIGNPKAMELFYPNPDYLEKDWNSSIDPMSKDNVYNLVTKQGKIRTIQWFDIYHKLKIPGWASWGIGQDITERKLAEEALLESEERFRNLSNLLPQVVFETDLNGKLIYVNQIAYELFGYSDDDFNKGLNAFSMLIAEDKKVAIERMKAIIKERGSLKSEYTALRKDGSTFPVIVYTNTIIRNNKLTGIRGIIFDITELKQAEKALQISAAQLKSSIDYTPNVAIQWFDRKGHVLFWNPASESLFGWTANEAMGKTLDLDLLIYNSEETAELIQILKGILETGKPYGPYETSVRQRDGSKCWVLSTIFSFPLSENQIGFACMSVDISNRKRAEQELEKYQTQLETLVQVRTEELEATIEELNAANEDLYNQRKVLQSALDKLNETQKQLIQSEKMASLGVLSAGIAHEINNPLNFIHGGILAIEHYFNETENEQNEEIYPFLNAINVGVKRASDIVTSLSHYIKKDDLPFVECDIHSIIDNCLIILQNQLKDKVVVQKQYTQKPHTIWGNEGKLHQVFLNIITNAEQAIDEKGDITILTEAENNSLVIDLMDSGSGISKENLQKIFDPFFTTKAPGKGTGLGLSITYNIIQEHNGTIDIDSQLGMGTKATIKFSLAKQDQL